MKGVWRMAPGLRSGDAKDNKQPTKQPARAGPRGIKIPRSTVFIYLCIFMYIYVYLLSVIIFIYLLTEGVYKQLMV
jgi:hypothetical protein